MDTWGVYLILGSPQARSPTLASEAHTVSETQEKEGV